MGEPPVGQTTPLSNNCVTEVVSSRLFRRTGVYRGARYNLLIHMGETGKTGGVSEGNRTPNLRIHSPML